MPTEGDAEAAPDPSPSIDVGNVNDEAPVQVAEAEKTEEPIPQTPKTLLTFLLVSSKRRDMSFEPDTSVMRVKELVWNSWPKEWQDEGDRPPAPSYLRIIHAGKILQDDDTLTDAGLPTHTPGPDGLPGPRTIVHLSVRLTPGNGGSQGDSIFKKKKRGSSTDNTESVGCCASCIIS
ncbi:ubiquitin-related domain-containing protein [Flagelloscypha sp. PMI_526]|nr:ubiquitin-related domain-containing protein [Flagelloscypha sp. PMI_526]